MLDIYMLYIILLLLIASLVISSIILYKNQKKENYDYTCSVSGNWVNGSSSIGISQCVNSYNVVLNNSGIIQYGYYDEANNVINIMFPNSSSVSHTYTAFINPDGSLTFNGLNYQNANNII